MWISFQVWVFSTDFGIDMNLAIWDSLVSTILILGLIGGIRNILHIYVPGSNKFWFAMGLSFFLSWFWIWILHFSLKELALSDSVYLTFLDKSFYVRWALGFLLMACFSIIGIYHYQLDEQKSETEREAKTNEMLRDAELKKLQLQLQPHFLFNSLNSINAMILVNPAEAQQMVQQLSEFLRITSKRADEQWIAFSEEWKYVDLYLAIEKVRFGHRLKVISDLDESASAYLIPTLLFQPLVENAIKFGLYGTAADVVIKIKTKLKDTMLHIEISNPFDTDMLPQKGSGFGLNGLRRRLYLLYARNDLLQTNDSENNFTVILKLPTNK